APIAGSEPHHDSEAPEESEAQAEALPGFAIDPALATSLGLDADARRALLGSFGFRSVGDPALERWRWLGRRSGEKRRSPRHRRKGAEPRPGAPKTQVPRSEKAPRAKKGKSGKAPHTGSRAARGDRTARRGPSPHSPFAGLADLLAGARED